MNTVDSTIINTSTTFASLNELREAHFALLERQRSDDELSNTTITAIKAFIQRSVATGGLLDSDSDRRVAQSLLDYWSNVLHRVGDEPLDALLADFDPTLAPELPDSACPYVGLEAFRE